MNNEQELDDAKNFPRRWLQHWLEHLRQLHGSLTFLHTMGGLSARYTAIEPAPDPGRYGLEKFIRVLEGMCAYEDEEDFVKFGYTSSAVFWANGDKAKAIAISYFFFKAA